MVTPEKRNYLDEAYCRLALPQRGKLGITEDDVLLFAYRETVRRELDTKGFIITPDIASAADIIVPANGTASVPVTIPEDFFPIPGVHPYALSVLHATTRSRHAQAGLEIVKGGILHNKVTVINHPNRPIGISKGETFCYAYYYDGQTMRGEELDSGIGAEQDAKIRVVGEENVDWRKWYGVNEIHIPKNLQGIEFMIDPESRRWIAPSNEPIRLHDKDAENHLRGLLDTFLVKSIPQTDEQIFWVSESSAELYLNSSVHGILEWLVDEGDHNFQTNSVIFRGGNTYGRMRYEIMSPTSEEQIPKTVIMRFVKSRASLQSK